MSQLPDYDRDMFPIFMICVIIFVSVITILSVISGQNYKSTEQQVYENFTCEELKNKILTNNNPTIDLLKGYKTNCINEQIEIKVGINSKGKT